MLSYASQVYIYCCLDDDKHWCDSDKIVYNRALCVQRALQSFINRNELNWNEYQKFSCFLISVGFYIQYSWCFCFVSIRFDYSSMWHLCAFFGICVWLLDRLNRAATNSHFLSIIRSLVFLYRWVMGDGWEVGYKWLFSMTLIFFVLFLHPFNVYLTYSDNKQKFFHRQQLSFWQCFLTSYTHRLRTRYTRNLFGFRAHKAFSNVNANPC